MTGLGGVFFPPGMVLELSANHEGRRSQNPMTEPAAVQTVTLYRMRSTVTNPPSDGIGATDHRSGVSPRTRTLLVSRPKDRTTDGFGGAKDKI